MDLVKKGNVLKGSNEQFSILWKSYFFMLRVMEMEISKCDHVVD